jgi:hypothetical protein
MSDNGIDKEDHIKTDNMVKSLLKIDEVNHLIRELQKIDSKLQSGQFIQAWRENRRLIAHCEQLKNDIISNSQKSPK